MPRIRHISIMSPDPAPLAAFYTANFDMREVARGAEGDIDLTDGGYAVAIVKRRPGLRELRLEDGLHHIGIAVENIDETVARYLARYPRGAVVAETGGARRGEVRVHDPECNPVALSQANFGLPDAPPGLPRVAHMALNALDTEAIRDFYASVFGFREVFEAHKEARKRPGYRNKHVGDGFTNVAIQAFFSGEEGHEARFGVAHVGFLTPDSKAMAEKVARGGASVQARPAHRTQSEIRMRDPQGNGADLSQRGWEVDTDTWARP